MLEAPPQKLKVQTLSRTHPGYSRGRDSDLWALYEGGREVDAQRFLIKRRAEPTEIYQERVKRFYYIGYVGQIIDSFTSQLFMAPPALGIGVDHEPVPDELAAWAKNVDGDETTLAAFMLDRVLHALVQRCAYTWVELPPVPEELEGKERITVAEAEQAGLRQPYLVPVSASELLDFKCDKTGNFEWVTIGQHSDDRLSPYDDERIRTHTWTILTREGYARYQLEQKLQFEHGRWVGDEKDIASKEADLRGQGTHRFGRVPLVRYELPSGLWVGGKLEGVQRQLLELDNGLSWQQLMSLYAMPVIKSKKKFSQMMGEAYAIHLEPNDTFEHAEPAGTAFAATMEHRNALKEEAFRITHQMAQSVGSEANVAGRSGESKKRDQNPTLVVLEALATRTLEHIAKVVELWKLVAGQAGLDVHVSGLDEFDLEDGSAFLDDAAKVQTITMPSPTFKKELAKKAARTALPKLTPATLEKIDEEIDSAPEEAFATFDPLLGAPPGKEDAAA